MSDNTFNQADDAIDPQREAYRNGELSADEAAAFEARLASDAALRRDYEAETQMLALLAEDENDDASQPEGTAMSLSPEAFTEAVLARWDDERAARAARATWLSPWRLGIGSLAAAAAMALVAYVGMQMFTGEAAPDGPQIVEGAPTGPVGPASPESLQVFEPVSAEEGGQAMATLVKETQATFVDRPRVFWQQLEARMSAMSIEQLPELLPSPIPDPASLLEEPTGEDPGDRAQLLTSPAPQATL